jgi:threonine 3-dehydrogenase
MRVLVTGASGQLGSDLVPALLGRGATVFASDITPKPKTLPNGVEWIPLDVTSPEECVEAMKHAKAHSVFHLAAILSATGERIPFRAWRINLDGTKNLLDAMRATDCSQMIFCSTIAAFGPGLPDLVPNDVSMRPTTMYGITKVMGELLGEYYHLKFGIDFRGVRFPGLISAVEPGGGTSDYVNYMYFDGVRKGHYEAFCRADTRIPLMYMPDALAGLVNLSEANPTSLKHRMFNIAAMSPRADEIAACVAKHVPRAKFTFAPNPMKQAILDSWPKRLDDTCAREEWGWTPQYDLETMTIDLLAKIRNL